MPVDTSVQIRIHEKMLENVNVALEKISVVKPQIDQELAAAESCGDVPKMQEITPKKRHVRGQELCLLSQNKRLKERIKCLQTGCSIST
jgi:hypothetical protein